MSDQKPKKPSRSVDSTSDFEPIVNQMEITQDFIAQDGSPIPLASATQATDSTAAKANVIKLSQLGDFRLVAKLGEGGMGTVYRGQHLPTKRFVAIKVMNKLIAEKPGNLSRFHREAALMRRLKHPNMIRCVNSGESHGFYYLAMELADAGSLGDWTVKLGKIPIGDLVTLMIGVANGLQSAHEDNMIHRDIKPDNILLTKSGIAKIADLGLAKIADDSTSMTQTGIGIGTPLYAAPEQIRDAKNVDSRCDIYSLGCVIYFCLTGKTPFPGQSLLEVIKMKEKGTFPAASRHNPTIPASIDRLISKMIAKLPEHRYENCAEIAQELGFTGLASAKISFLK